MILVTGASGYIASITCRALRQAGLDVVGVDRVPLPPNHPLDETVFRLMDVTNISAMTKVLGEFRPTGAIHFAALVDVAQSVREPLPTYRDNVIGTLAVLEVARTNGIESIVFSSSCAVYGAPKESPVDERSPLHPVSPYGASKVFAERLFEDAACHGIRSVRLRYFNAAGATRDALLGERHDPEPHLIPNVLRAALGKGPALEVFGNDYPTSDGSAIRDFVHVEDLASAHVKALLRLLSGGTGGVWNLGSEHGTSVLGLIQAAERVVGRPVPYRFSPRRPGDPPALWASSARAQAELGWQPTHRDLHTMLEDALRFERTRR